MAKRTVQTEPQVANLTPDQMMIGMQRIESRILDIERFNPNSINETPDHNLSALQTSIDETLQRVFGSNTVEYSRYRDAAFLDLSPLMMNSRHSIERTRGYIQSGKDRSLALLKQAVRGLREELEYTAAPAGTDTPPPPIEKRSDKVFIVHGHDDGMKETVARFLSKLDLIPVILHELPNKGRTIITKFREESADIGFALVLMTPDDQGAKSGAELQPRARQNVVFELGFFIGALGPDRVSALVKGSVERPSDFDGVVYISLDRGDWKNELGKELDAAGYNIDWNKVMRG